MNYQVKYQFTIVYQLIFGLGVDAQMSEHTITLIYRQLGSNKRSEKFVLFINYKDVNSTL